MPTDFVYSTGVVELKDWKKSTAETIESNFEIVFDQITKVLARKEIFCPDNKKAKVDLAAITFP